MLPGRQAFENLRAHRALSHIGDKALDDGKIDVRLQKRELYLAHRLFDFLLIKLAAAGKLFEYSLKFCGKPVKRHGIPPSIAPSRRSFSEARS
ncbi:hypothetical protein SDC9_211908 [bioreactor metagenome]|uniref:Uncharacterized protein n=1 Tax=bioreactor metagenome TaxID=1076179 RepID=A0A645JLA3_9ZZZZ